METKDVIRTMSALAQPTRLATFRALVEAGENGMGAGDLARAVGTPANTMSAHLTILAAAGLVTQERTGRHVVYSAVSERAVELTEFLTALKR